MHTTTWARWWTCSKTRRPRSSTTDRRWRSPKRHVRAPRQPQPSLTPLRLRLTAALAPPRIRGGMLGRRPGGAGPCVLQHGRHLHRHGRVRPRHCAHQQEHRHCARDDGPCRRSRRALQPGYTASSTANGAGSASLTPCRPTLASASAGLAYLKMGNYRRARDLFDVCQCTPPGRDALGGAAARRRCSPLTRAAPVRIGDQTLAWTARTTTCARPTPASTLCVPPGCCCWSSGSTA